MTRFQRWSLAIALFFAIFAGLWLGRLQLSNVVIADWFAARQLSARYRVAAISPSSAILEAVSIGSAAHPDFFAQRVIIAFGGSPLQPHIDFVTLVSPRLRVKVTPGSVSFGSLDRLLPGPNDPPQRFPDLDLRIIEGRIDFATAIGPMTASVVGHGGLRDGFVGTAVFNPASLTIADCRFVIASAEVKVALQRNATRLSSTLAVPRVACPKQAFATAISGHVTATLPPELDRYTARLEMDLANGAASGFAVGYTRLWLDATAGSLAAPPNGHFGASSTDLVAAKPQGAARQIVATGRYKLGKTLDAASLDSEIAIAGGSITLALPSIRDYARRTAGTMAQPLLVSLASNVAVAAEAFDAKARVVVPRVVDVDRHILLSALRVRSVSGATVVQDGVIDLTSAATSMSGRLALSGGALPSARLTGHGGWHAGQFDGGLTLALGRWASGGAVVDAATLVAKGHDGVESLDGRVQVSGALGGNMTATALGIPLAFRRARDGSIRFGDHCLVLDWRTLGSPAVHLGAGSIDACPSNAAMAILSGHSLAGKLQLLPLVLRGAIGTCPLLLSSGAAQLVFAGNIDHPHVTLIPALITGELAAHRFHGLFGGNIDISTGIGTLTVARTGVAGQDLPVVLQDASAVLALAGGRLTLSAGSGRLSDALVPARFQPLRLAGVSGTLAAEQAVIKGNARLDAGSVPLFAFTAQHDLASGRGSAMLETGNLVFGPELQPYQITESLRGVVENVAGTINGSGQFKWTAAGLTSRGTLRIDKVDLATAALGPVTRIEGRLAFDDLTALTTPAGQTLQIGRINPGVLVDDGVVVFHLLGPDAVAIDSIRWPYAGGALTLAPVTIRVADKVRNFRLTAENLDAEQFLQRFEIKNLNVTGRFDGILPLIFTNGQGRIVGGHLQARNGGGLIQYVGEIGGENVGASAKLAFDALRRLRYRNLRLDLDGDLDAELVTQLHFDGISETPSRIGAAVPIKAIGLPFKFNVTVRAPFRALLGTAASFSDVRPLLRPPGNGVQPR